MPHSTVLLGNPTAGQLVSDPYAYLNAWSSSGTVRIADGATVYLGGFLTADQYQGLTAIPGVIMHAAADVLCVDGTIDNSPADNPRSGGLLNTARMPLTLAGGTVIGGSITAGSKVQVTTAMPIPIPADVLGGFTTFTATGGWLDDLTSGAKLTDTASTVTLSNVTNNGTVSGVTGAVVEFANAWANPGTIKVDGTSILYLGSPVLSYYSAPPTAPDVSPWNPAAVGTIAIADGATVAIGGLLTTDLFTAFPTLPGVRIHPALDTVLLDGWLDNHPADNPVTGGVLALTSPLTMAGGAISGGTITTTGAGVLNVINFGGPLYLAGGVLDSVTNNGTIAVPNFGIDLEGNIVNNGTLTAYDSGVQCLAGGSFINNGTFALSFAGANFASPVTNNGTITVSNGGAFDTYGADLTNNRTITVSSASLYVMGNMVNAGTMSATSSGIALYGSYDNSRGTITIDSTSTVVLGQTTLNQQNFPTIADGTRTPSTPARSAPSRSPMAPRSSWAA